MLLLVVICVIPFALAQRGLGKRALAPKGTCPTPWTLVADMPLDLEGAAGASDGTYFYSAGGFSSSLFAILDAVSPTIPAPTPGIRWRPCRRQSLLGSQSITRLGSKIYVFGGMIDIDTGDNTNITQVYDITSNTWTQGC